MYIILISFSKFQHLCIHWNIVVEKVYINASCLSNVFQANQTHCDELHAIAEESKAKIKTIQEQYLKRADEINAMMAEKHRGEVTAMNIIIILAIRAISVWKF